MAGRKKNEGEPITGVNIEPETTPFTLAEAMYLAAHHIHRLVDSTGLRHGQLVIDTNHLKAIAVDFSDAGASKEETATFIKEKVEGRWSQIENLWESLEEDFDSYYDEDGVLQISM